MSSKVRHGIDEAVGVLADVLQIGGIEIPGFHILPDAGDILAVNVGGLLVHRQKQVNVLQDLLIGQLDLGQAGELHPQPPHILLSQEQGVVGLVHFRRQIADVDRGPGTFCCGHSEVQSVLADYSDRCHNVRFFTVTDDWIFAVLENKKGQQFIYQISSDLKSAAVIKKDVHICWQIAADAEFLYYMTGYPKGVSLMQYDIRNKTERAILKDKGLSRFQLYRKHLIVATYETIGAYGGDDGEKLILISLKQMKQRSLSAERIALNELTCYLDFAFYIEKKTGFIYALPLTGGTPQLVYKREAVKLNISRGVLDFIDYDREQRICVPIVAQAGESKDNIPGYTGYKIPLPNVSNSGAEPDYLAMKTQPILQSQPQTASKEPSQPQHPFWGANQEAAEKFLEKTNVYDRIYIQVEDQMTSDFSKMLSILRSLTILRNAKEVNLFSGNVKNHLTLFPFDFTLNQREKQIKQYCAKCHVQLQQGEVPYYFLDTTSFCTKAHGIVATNYGLYLSDPRKDNPLLYQNITAMPCGMMDSMEIIYSGKNAKVKLPCDELLNNFLIFTCMYFKYGQG